jgi:hypothetical protein
VFEDWDLRGDEKMKHSSSGAFFIYQRALSQQYHRPDTTALAGLAESAGSWLTANYQEDTSPVCLMSFVGSSANQIWSERYE